MWLYMKQVGGDRPSYGFDMVNRDSMRNIEVGSLNTGD